MEQLNRLERIIESEHRTIEENFMLLDFQIISTKLLECTNYDQINSMRDQLMKVYKLDEVQYNRYINTATEYNFWRVETNIFEESLK